MVLKIKSGGVWNTVADGKISVKSGGAWKAPSVIWIKSGGAWHDTGYRGPPNPPTNLHVTAWDYDSTTVAWGNPGTGPAIAEWHIERLDANGKSVEGYLQTATSKSFNTPEDTRHQFRVRSHGTNGLYSAWVGPGPRVGIGHPATYNYGYVTRTRAWASNHVSGSRNKDAWFAVTIPASVVFTSMHWRNLRTGGFSSVVTPFGTHTVNWIIAGQDYGQVDAKTGTLYNGDDRDNPFNNNGQGAAWGIIPRGSGWSTTGNGYLMLWVDDFWCSGTETYQNYEIVSTDPAQGNYYW